MQETSPRVQKERQDKYQRLIRMIKGFQRTNDELKMLEKIKNDTVFEISLRFRRCEANKTYRFPKKDESSDEDEINEETQELVCDKELVYNLHLQNRYRSDPSRDRHRMKLEIDEHPLSKRQKTEVTTSTTRVSSLGNERSRHSRHRIDRIEKLQHWTAERERLKPQRVSEKRIKEAPVEMSVGRIPAGMQCLEICSKGLIQSENASSNASNHLSQVRQLVLPAKREVCKTEISPVKFDHSRPKIKLITEESERTSRKTSQKKLHTEVSGETIKKGRIHNLLTNQIKKAEKTTILVGLAETTKLKPKNLFHKQIY